MRIIKRITERACSHCHGHGVLPERVVIRPGEPMTKPTTVPGMQCVACKGTGFIVTKRITTEIVEKDA